MLEQWQQKTNIGCSRGNAKPQTTLELAINQLPRSAWIVSVRKLLLNTKYNYQCASVTIYIMLREINACNNKTHPILQVFHLHSTKTLRHHKKHVRIRMNTKHKHPNSSSTGKRLTKKATDWGQMNYLFGLQTNGVYNAACGNKTYYCKNSKLRRIQL